MQPSQISVTSAVTKCLYWMHPSFNWLSIRLVYRTKVILPLAFGIIPKSSILLANGLCFHCARFQGVWFKRFVMPKRYFIFRNPYTDASWHTYNIYTQSPIFVLLIQITWLIEKCISLVAYIPYSNNWKIREMLCVAAVISIFRIHTFYTNTSFALSLIQYIVQYTHIIQHRHTRSYYHGRYTSCTTTLRAAAAQAPSIASLCW